MNPSIEGKQNIGCSKDATVRVCSNQIIFYTEKYVKYNKLQILMLCTVYCTVLTVKSSGSMPLMNLSDRDEITSG
jgi:hypothetical protein